MNLKLATLLLSSSLLAACVKPHEELCYDPSLWPYQTCLSVGSDGPSIIVPPVKPDLEDHGGDAEGMQYEVLGKMGNRYWVYKKNGTVSTIAQYNDQMQLVKQNDLTFCI